jgi:predicted Rossmann fold nucleotide-binding protein DprA/Smf involved in DNA uptake
LLQAETDGIGTANLFAADGLTPTDKKVYELLSAEEPRHSDDIVENTGLNSSDVLATLFTLERKGIIRQLPGKQFGKDFVMRGERVPLGASDASE